MAVARILGGGRRKRTRAFTELQSHYLFSDRFGRVGKGNDKGSVEGMVGYGRRNFLVPIPRAENFDELNAHLESECLERMDARLRGHTESIGERMERDLGALLALPAVPYDASDKHATRVSSQSLVRYRTNDYSVPVAFGHRDVLVRGYVDEVVISCGTDVIARHRRSYEHDDFVFNPLHYLALLEQKTGALDQAAPLAGWDLPEEYGRLRRLQESRMGRPGKREFVRVLRLLETFPADEVHAAVQDAIGRGATGYDAVKHLLLCRIEGRPPRLDLDLHPHLPSVSVSTTSAGDYMKLLRGRRHRERQTDTAAGTSPEGAEAADLPERVRQDRRAVRLRGSGLSGLPAQAVGTGTHRPPSPPGGSQDQGRDFPAVKSLDAFDFPAIPSVNRQLVQLARCEYIESRENVIAIGNSGTGKTHIALGLGLAACQKGLTVGFTTASALVNELMEARDEMRLLNLQKKSIDWNCSSRSSDYERSSIPACRSTSGPTGSS